MKTKEEIKKAIEYIDEYIKVMHIDKYLYIEKEPKDFPSLAFPYTARDFLKWVLGKD